jgi:hypothetical protein
MRTILHILTKPDDSLAQEIISKQRENSGNKIEVMDFNRGEPNYKELLEKIFAADSVEVW